MTRHVYRVTVESWARDYGGRSRPTLLHAARGRMSVPTLRHLRGAAPCLDACGTTNARTHARTHARPPARPHARTHARRTHARTHARPHARTHARTHAHTHTHTHTQWTAGHMELWSRLQKCFGQTATERRNKTSR